MEPSLKDPPRGWHNSLFKFPNVHFLILLIHFEPLKSRQPLFKGRNGWPQSVLYSEVISICYDTSQCMYMYMYVNPINKMNKYSMHMYVNPINKMNKYSMHIQYCHSYTCMHMYMTSLTTCTV